MTFKEKTILAAVLALLLIGIYGCLTNQIPNVAVNRKGVWTYLHGSQFPPALK